MTRLYLMVKMWNIAWEPIRSKPIRSTLCESLIVIVAVNRVTGCVCKKWCETHMLTPFFDFEIQKYIWLLTADK